MYACYWKYRNTMQMFIIIPKPERDAMPVSPRVWPMMWTMEGHKGIFIPAGPGLPCFYWQEQKIPVGSDRWKTEYIHGTRKRYPNWRPGTRKSWRKRRMSMTTFRQAIIIKTDITCFYGLKNTRQTIFCFLRIIGCRQPTMKQKGFWGIIKENNSRPWHSGVSRASMISVNAWACLLWCEKMEKRIYMTECPRYLDKENRWSSTNNSLYHRFF